MRISGGWRRAWLYGFVQSEAFTLGFLGLLFAIGVGFITIVCALDLVRRGELELCAVAVVTGTAIVAIASEHLSRSVSEAIRSYNATKRLLNDVHGTVDG